jgi:ribosomal protein S14
MKKGISEDKVQRMRNLVSGNYQDKTKISTGFTKSKTKHKEGDVWEESGKTWTIENGIKQTINKLDEARKAIRIPLECPKCGDPRMTHPAYKKMYKKFGMCFNCVVKFERDLKNAGKYDEYISKINKASSESWIKHMTEEYQDWLDSRDSNSYVTEAGDIENWEGGKTKETLQSEFEKQKIKINKELEEHYGDSE